MKSAWPAAGTNPFTGQLVRWIEGTGDNQGLPFAVMDKQAACIHVFSAQAQWRGTAYWVRRAATNQCLASASARWPRSGPRNAPPRPAVL